ncbi:putative multidrug resistance protein EmrY [Mycobacterium talmoniae]|uniref:Putative multidrug resistance protein EmrY n=1 Tax=Mycobacterium talmoniae TaxID=1858794 RepID=A0A2S8BF61_9MYCO|nr:putative multidrug resistance protein EmrY [Mycobacterium talmoniae]
MDARVVDRKAGKTAWAILAAMGVASFGAALLFSTAIGPALPAIKTDLNLSLAEQTWTITAYTLAFGVALVAGGRMGDVIGEAKIIVTGFIVFGAGLVLSAVAISGLVIISGRAIQGVGVGICAPATLSIVVNTFPIARRGFAIGVWGFAHGLGTFAGPLFTAWMMRIASWRAVFWAALLLAALVIVITMLATRGYKSVPAQGKYDWAGLLIGGTGITLITYVLQNSSGNLTAATLGALLAAGVVLLCVFTYAEKRTASPLVDFSLWRERLFLVGCVGNAAVGFIYIPFLTFVGSLLFIDVLGYSPTRAGWVIVMTTGVCMLCQPPAGRWVDKVGPGLPITAALALQALALAWIGASFGPVTTVAHMAAPLTLMGIGVGIALPACNTAAMSAVDTKRAGMGSGVMQMAFSIAASLGMALVTSVAGVSGGAKSAARPGQHTEFHELADRYANAVQHGKFAQANDILATLPSDSADAIKRAAAATLSSVITMSMLVLAPLALAAALFTWVIVGRRRVPDCTELTEP